ncbi:MarR family transcriptional regulator [Microbacterium protaetiae]|uniref:MarR family transcriptional regulator n=1 Tax=Microbacterium protaetiae TaxID=2509458 RepID=A0A4P6EN59_9MICO|nr:MarR family transcriptional regulator [Microbacterium protaetiae]QAY59328.1 MarR family transcriptional regulator [Microbacterium protaetiae]
MPDSAPSSVTTATEAPPVTLLYLIKQVELAVRSRLDELAAAHGITTIQYTALTVLERHPGLIAAQLARTSFVRAQSMTQLLDALESRGLVQRVRDPSSRRQLRIFLTDAAHELLDRMREPAAEIERDMTAALTLGDVEALSGMLQSCRIALAGAAAR